MNDLQKGADASERYNMHDVDNTNDPYLKSLVEYLLEFGKYAVAAYEPFTRAVLVSSDLYERVNVFTDLLNSVTTTGTCVDQVTNEYAALKSSAVQKYKICSNANKFPADFFDWNIANTISLVAKLDKRIQEVVDQCSRYGLNRDECEAKSPGKFAALRTEARSKNVMDLYVVASSRIMINAKSVAGCLAKSTDLIGRIDKSIQQLYKCLEQH